MSETQDPGGRSKWDVGGLKLDRRPIKFTVKKIKVLGSPLEMKSLDLDPLPVVSCLWLCYIRCKRDFEDKAKVAY